MARTRLDRIVKLRERGETDAMVHLARAQATLRAAQALLEDAVERASADWRGAGRAAEWELEDAAHRRDLHSLRLAEGQVEAAAKERDDASEGYREARQDAEAMRRAAERRRAEILAERARRERRAVDEIAILRFGAK